MDFPNRVASLIGMIAPAEGVLTPEAATEWLREWAGDYARVIQFGLECEAAEDREAFGMLAAEFSWVLDACGQAIATGESVRLELHPGGEPAERAERCGELARIIAARPDHSTGPFEDVYEELARRIVALLEPREAA